MLGKREIRKFNICQLAFQAKELQKYQAIIDIQDIVSTQKMRTENETAQYIQDPEVKKYYKYDYYIQLSLSKVEGHSLKQILKQNSKRESGGSEEELKLSKKSSSKFEEHTTMRESSDHSHVHVTYH